LGRGELGPHLTHCGYGRGLLPYQMHLDSSIRFVTTGIGRKLEGGCAPLGEGSWSVAWTEAYLRTKLHLDPFSRWPQQTWPKVVGCAPLGTAHNFRRTKYHSTPTSQTGQTDRTTVRWDRANRFINCRPKIWHKMQLMYLVA